MAFLRSGFFHCAVGFVLAFGANTAIAQRALVSNTPALCVGSSGTCGETTDGAGYCWGNNANGAVGDGTKEVRHVPTRIVGLTLGGS